jgi:hypothetical protein
MTQPSPRGCLLREVHGPRLSLWRSSGARAHAVAILVSGCRGLLELRQRPPRAAPQPPPPRIGLNMGFNRRFRNRTATSNPRVAGSNPAGRIEVLCGFPARAGPRKGPPGGNESGNGSERRRAAFVIRGTTRDGRQAEVSCDDPGVARLDAQGHRRGLVGDEEIVEAALLAEALHEQVSATATGPRLGRRSRRSRADADPPRLVLRTRPLRSRGRGVRALVPDPSRRGRVTFSTEHDEEDRDRAHPRGGSQEASK